MLAPVPSMEFESEIPPDGNPDSGQKQHALASAFLPVIPGRCTASNWDALRTFENLEIPGMVLRTIPE